MFGREKDTKDSLAWRGDADEYDEDVPGPGYVDDPPESTKYDTYNWAGRKTGSWVTLGKQDN